ncbi:MAG: hypothetical protein PHU40_03715 [Sulfurimonas sp.]|nr:hypothetical protein [Sulfurimonas sp.]
MAIGSIGNAVFVNQMTANATALQNAHNNRIEFQNMVAQAAANEKDEKVMEVRPAEENQEVDPDREHQKDEADAQNKRNPKKDEDESEKEAEKTHHILDIKV